MWELILISIIVLAALLYIGKLYLGKLRERDLESSDQPAQSTGCSGTCNCGLESCLEKQSWTQGLLGLETKPDRHGREPRDPVLENRNG